MGQVYGVEAGWSYIEEDEYKNVLNCIVAGRNEKRGQKVRSICSFVLCLFDRHHILMTWHIWISEYGVNHEPLAR
jgi:hypothetical protein